MSDSLVGDRHPAGGSRSRAAGSGETAPWRERLRSTGLELLLLAGMYALYQLGRALARGQEAEAVGNAALVRGLESALRLPSEAGLQDAFGAESVLRLANTYYTSVHFPLMAAFLIWGFAFRPRREYRWARNLVALQTGAAVVIHVLFPLAPPRMFPQWGFLDSMTAYGPSPYSGSGGEIANQFAAMPSLHVGWAVLIAFVVTRTARRAAAVVAWAHAALTVLIVVITANHWWFDGIVAVALLALAAAAIRLPAMGPCTSSDDRPAIEGRLL